MDNASYHNRKTFLTPNMSWKKETMIAFVQEKCNDFKWTFNEMQERQITKTMILDEISNRKIRPSLQTDQILAKYDILILRLPPYHCKFNPIEKVWSGLKRKVRRRNIQEQTRDVVWQLLYECISLEDKNWAGYVSHCERLEADALELVLSESLEDPEEIVMLCFVALLKWK